MASPRHLTTRHLRLALVVILPPAMLLAGISGCGSASVPTGTLPVEDDTIALAEGITVSGPPRAVPSGVTLSVEALSRTQAAVYSGLAQAAGMASAARLGQPGIPLRAPVTVTVALGYQVFPGTNLELYTRYRREWRPTYARATVSQSGSAVAYSVDRCGEYALVFDPTWCRARWDGVDLIQTAVPPPATDTESAAVLASGDKDDPPLLAAVMAATGYSRAQATELLASYDDSGPNVVRVLRLRRAASVVRYSTPDSRYGRWFAPSGTDAPLSPKEAKAAYALPQSNSAHVASLVSLQPGAEVVHGICADMSHDPAFGRYAIGGGEQFFAPTATLYPPARWNPQVAVPLSTLRFPEP